MRVTRSYLQPTFNQMVDSLIDRQGALLIPAGAGLMDVFTYTIRAGTYGILKLYTGSSIQIPVAINDIRMRVVLQRPGGAAVDLIDFWNRSVNRDFFVQSCEIPMPVGTVITAQAANAGAVDRNVRMGAVIDLIFP